MKNKTGGITIKEFVGLNLKMDSFLQMIEVSIKRQRV